jgi:hypothetical protein
MFGSKAEKKDPKEKLMVYIAHPISGDIANNKEKVRKICEKIHKSSDKIIPLAPYLVPLSYLDDDIPEERHMGIEANKAMFRRGGFDELWLCGEKISDGMKEEVELCVELDVPVVCYNGDLTEELMKFKMTGQWTVPRKK